ncbi:MAG: RluA family pseudouridine synthase [Chloroflexi bacterium]|nr:RluA family pseudouridine synthase [Chloroflexota bacterium]MDA0242465.1 RluA family pseudouridine synthase [Chloroflexota bacterium]
MSNILTLNLPATGERLDKALTVAYPDFSRSQWQKLLAEGLVTTADGQPIKPKFKIDETLTVTVALPETADTTLEAENIPLDILYEDSDLLAINKPAGLVVHPALGNHTGTLVNALLFYCGDEFVVGNERRPGIIHRLDKDTSGIILVAKNDKTLDFLQKQFKRRTVKKEYLALVEGRIQPEAALIDAPIGRDVRQRKKMAVIRPGGSATARPAQTRYAIETQYEGYTLVRCFPLTGRTHQIRVHLAFVGYPIVGDTVYGRAKQTVRLKRHFLHAARITFIRPSDKTEVALEAPLPSDLTHLLRQLEEV